MDRFLNRAKRILTGLLTISVLAASFPELALATEVVNDVAEVVQSDGLSASEPEGVTEEAAGQVEERDNDNQTETDGIIENYNLVEADNDEASVEEKEIEATDEVSDSLMADSYVPEGASYGLTWSMESGEVYITGYTGIPAGELIIPANIGGKEVVAIQSNAFKNCNLFTGDLEIPSSVKKIGLQAFWGCSGLTSVSMPGVLEVQERAFYQCSGLKQVDFGESLKEIEMLAFSECTGLEGDLTLPDSLTEMGESAFKKCTGFTGDLQISKGLKTIPQYAFAESGFKGNLIIPEGVETIDDYAFDKCSGFTGDLVLPESLKTLDQYAFRNCTGFDGELTIKGVSLTEISSSAFYGCSGFIGDLVIPNSVTRVRGYAFYNCSGFSNLKIPENVSRIDGRAFDGCTGLETVVNNSGIEVNLSGICSNATWKNVATDEIISVLPARSLAVRTDNAGTEDDYCTDGKVQLTVEQGGFTKVVMTDGVIGTRTCTLKVYRKGKSDHLSMCTYSFKNSDPGNVMWIFVDPDKKSWHSNWTFKDIASKNGTYYVTLETDNKVYRSDDFVYTKPDEKLDAPDINTFNVVEQGERGWGRYLNWDDIDNTTGNCAGYEFEATNSENGKKSNFMLFYPNEQFGYCLDNMYNALGAGKWKIRIRALSKDINEVTVGDWTEYEYNMASRVAATSVGLSATKLTLYTEDSEPSADITATVNPATVTLTGVSWKSSNENVVTIEDKGNNVVKVTAVGAGTAMITATTFDSTHKTATCTVTVRESRPVVSFTGINSDIRLFTPGANNGPGQLGDVIGADGNGNVSLIADYGQTIYFIPAPEDNAHEIDTVKAGTRALSAVKGKYTDSGVTKDIQYYQLSNIIAPQTVSITQKARAMTTEDYFVVDQSEATNTIFATTVATAGSNGKYYFKKGTRDLVFTASSDVAHVPVIKIGKLEGESFVSEETLTGTLKTDAKYTKRTYTYKMEAVKAAGKVIQITEQDAPQKQLRVKVQPVGVLKPVVKIGNDIVSGSFDVEEYVYNVPEYSTATVSYEFESGKSGYYKLVGITANGKAQAASVVSKGSVSTVVMDDESFVAFRATGITTMFLTKDDDTEIVSNNGIATLGSRDTATLQIRNGDSTEEPLALSSNSAIACVVKAGGKDVTGFATVSSDNKTVTIDAKTAALLNKNPVTVTLKGDGFAKQTIKFNVDQIVSGITAKNFKLDNSANRNIAAQNAGTVATYALTFAPKGAPLDNVHIKYVTGSDEDGQVFLATETNGSKVLSVDTFKDDKIATKPLMVQFYDDAGTTEESDDILIGSPFVVTPVAKFAAPTVQMRSSTDTKMNLSLAAPKGLDQYKNLYYEITATPVSPVSDRMIAAGVTQYEEITATETTLTLAKSNTPGAGAAQKYDVSVRIVQVIDKNGVNAGSGSGFGFENIFTADAGTVKKLSASTKAPYYETNLTLTGKKATFTQGEKTQGFESSGLYVAVAKFSSATTFASVDPAKSYVAGADGKKIAGANISVGADGVSIWISDTSVIPVGKAKLVVAPEAPEGAQYKTATLALTVKAPIDEIYLTQSGAMSSGNGTTLYKKQGTAATMKFTATPMWDGDDSNEGSWFKPASTKVEWSLTAPSRSELLNNSNATINTSNGTVTISKDYNPSGNTDLDKFTVTAKAADFTGNTVSASMTVELTSKAIEIKSAKVVEVVTGQPDKDVNVSNAAPVDLIGKTLKFYDKDGNWIDPINLVYKVSPAGIGLDSWGRIVSVSKAGKFTVTATSLDGGKSSLATTITNAGLTIGSAKVFVWDDDEDKYKEVTDFETVDSSTFGYMKFYDEKGNAIKCSDLDIKASTGLTLTLYSTDPSAAFITAIKQPGTYKVTATTKDGGKKTLVKDITFTETTEGYEVTKLKYSSGSNNADVFTTIPQLSDVASVQEAMVSNANAFCLDVFRADSGVYLYNATVTVAGGTIITKTTGTIWDDGGNVRQGGKYVIKPTKDVVDITVTGGGKKAVYKINVQSGTGKALTVNKLTKTEFIGATTASYDTSFAFETSEFKADTSKEYRLVFTPNEAYHKVKTPEERSAYDTLAAILETAGNEVVPTTITPTTGAVFTTKTLTNYGSVPVGSYKFDVTAVQVIRDGENSIIELVPLTKPLTVTFKANAPKAISAKLNNSGKVTIDDTASASAQMPFVSNSAYSSIINTETVKPILYNNNDKGAISSFKKYFDVTVSGDKLVLSRKSGEGAKYNWTDAEKKKGEAVIVGWVEYTVVGEDGASKITYCEKVTATLKYKGN